MLEHEIKPGGKTQMFWKLGTTPIVVFFSIKSLSDTFLCLRMNRFNIFSSAFNVLFWIGESRLDSHERAVELI